MKIKIIYWIIEKFKELDKNVKQIIILSLIVIVLFVGTTILKNIPNKTTFVWNYKKIESAKNVLAYGNINKDRYLYWNLKDIIYNYLSTMQDSEIDETENDIKADYKQYYDILTEKYKKHLNEKEYEEKAINFILCFLEEDHLGYKYVGDFVIKKIYEYDDNMYLCIVSNDVLTEDRYIGIKLDENKPKFSIFYIE